jgi:hypothetical protein
MTLMTPKEWFEQIVEPNYREYMQQPDDERRAFNAILAIHHFWDRVYQYWHRTDPTKLLGASDQASFLRCLIAKYGEDVEILNDVANALKHHFLTKKSLGRDPSQLWVTTATGSFQTIYGELEIGATGRSVKDVLSNAVVYCRLWAG